MLGHRLSRATHHVKHPWNDLFSFEDFMNRVDRFVVDFGDHIGDGRRNLLTGSFEDGSRRFLNGNTHFIGYPGNCSLGHLTVADIGEAEDDHCIRRCGIGTAECRSGTDPLGPDRKGFVFILNPAVATDAD